jgi:peptide/nickel transport system substrate-binding protein
MLSDTWSTGPDPTYLLSIQTCGDLPTSLSQPGNTDSFFCNKTFDQLYSQQGSEFSTAQRVQTIDQMQQILYQNAVDVILYYPDFLSAVRTSYVKDYFYGTPNAQGFYPSPSEFINWRSATPVASGSSASSSRAPVLIVVVIVVVLLLGGGAIFLRRRSTAGERE